jgi:hypothetical protein
MDPEYQRYRHKYPQFPGMQICLELLKRSNVKGAYLDALLADLENYAAEQPAEVIAAFEGVDDLRLRVLLLAALAEAAVPAALPLFTAQLSAPEEELRSWAIQGLRRLNCKEARRLLRQARP